MLVIETIGERMKPALFIFGILCFASVLAQAENNVDIQFNICEDIQSAKNKLALAERADSDNEIMLFDTDQLALYYGDIQIQLKYKKNKAVIFTKAFNLNEELFASFKKAGADCEYDHHGGMLIGSCKIDKEVDAILADNIKKGRTSLERVLSRSQLGMLDARKNLSSLLTHLRPLGPVIENRFVLEHDASWELKDDITPRGTHFIQFSVSAKYSKWQKTAEKVRAYLEKKNILLCLDQDGQREKKLRELLH